MVSMRDFLKSSVRWLQAGWIWPLVLLALPACGLATGGFTGGSNNTFDPGTGDLSSGVMCDIPKVQDNGRSGTCATSTDIGIGLSNSLAAVSLADGSGSSIVLDYSPSAQAECGAGMPRRVDFYDSFPEGSAICLNCQQQIPSKYADANAVCVAKCKDLVANDEVAPADGVDAYCQANAHVSTNFKPNMCFGNRCSTGGTPVPNYFADPRRDAEPVQWSDSELIGTMASGSSVSQTAPTPPDTGTIADFQAGAASVQLITTGDAWVEFSAAETGKSHVIGLRASCPKIADCPDTDPSLTDIAFSIDLNVDGFAYVLEHGTGAVATALGMYTPHERYRLHVADNHDGTATISYTRVTGSCVPGTPCTETPLTTHVGTHAKYPLRIDASFREQGATTENVTVMRIQDQ